MEHSYWLWIATFIYGLHAFEEYTFDWKDWAVAVVKLPVTWVHFAIANALVMVLGICCGAVAWACPAFALSLPALMLINATFFHVLPFLRTGFRWSPGLATAVLLFYPIAIAAYLGAQRDGVLTGGVLAGSLGLGAAWMASPVVMLKLRLHPYFRQDAG